MQAALRSCLRAVIGLTALALVHTTGASGQSVQEFYRGKKVTIVVGSDVTGEHDAAARLLSRHLPKHIPGHPTVVVQNMPGASGIKSANYLYAIAARDGSVLATFNKSMPLYQATGMANVNYKAQEFNWIGSMSHSNAVVVVAARTGVRTLADATGREVVMGSIGAGGTMSTYPLLLNNTFGTRFRLVQGYAGGQIVDLALDRGEIDGRGSYTWRDLRVKRADWLKTKKINILLQFGLEREPDLREVPALIDLARNETERAVFTFISSDIPIGKSFVMPPGVPAERIAALRQAFDATIRDRDFLADAKAADADIELTSGVQIERLVNQIVGTSPAIVQTAQEWMSAK